MFDDGQKLWKRVTATVTRLGEKRTKSSPHIRLWPNEPTNRLDLHGYKVHDAFRETSRFIDESSFNHLIIITGRSGQIREEFTRWLEKMPRVRTYEELNEGSFKIYLRKRK